MAYGDIKESNRRTFADKVLHGFAFNATRDPKNMVGINEDLLQWLINFLIKNLLVVVLKKIFLIKN